jgi:hypothetical protein
MTLRCLLATCYFVQVVTETTMAGQNLHKCMYVPSAKLS